MILLLASGSPRRRHLIERLGLPFRVEPSTVNERPPVPNEPPDAYALELAGQKAEEVAGRFVGEMVLAADTVVTLGARIFGKPRDADEACAMLTALQGRRHTVITAVVLRTTSGEVIRGAESSTVNMRAAGAEQLRRYVETSEPLDKAGAYAIQGQGAQLVASVAGCLENVVGLPLELCRDLLLLAGVQVPASKGSLCSPFIPSS